MRPEDFAIADSFHTHVGIDPRATHEELAVALGIVSRKELARMGFVTDRQIRAGIQTRQFTRIAHGRYALPHAHANARTAARQNARVTCLSACEMYGLWVPKQSELHVAIRRSSPLPAGSSLIFHRTGQIPAAPIVDVYSALAQVCSCADPETALIILESAMNQQLVTLDDLPQLTANAPLKAKRILHRAIATSQSGSETRVRNFFHSRRVPVRSQVQIPSVGFVDLLVGSSLIAECDSLAYHSRPADYHRDRVRDAHTRLLGYTVIRLSYDQIWDDWDNTKHLLQRVIRTRQHLRPPTPI